MRQDIGVRISKRFLFYIFQTILIISIYLSIYLSNLKPEFDQFNNLPKFAFVTVLIVGGVFYNTVSRVFVSLAI